MLSQKPKKIRGDDRYVLKENPSATARRLTSEDYWGGQPSTPRGSETPKEINESPRGDKRSERQSCSRPGFSPSKVITTTPKFVPSKEQKTREIRKKLHEREMLRKRRIMEEQRREETRKALVEEQQQKMKLQWQTRNRMKQELNHERRQSVEQAQSDWKHNIMVKLMREDEARTRKLSEFRDMLKMEKDDAYYDKIVGHLRDMEDNLLKNKSHQTPKGPDKVYTELWYRQEKLFRALGERSLDDIKDMLAFTPTILQTKPRKIYQDYGPHKRMQKLLNDLVANKITEPFFFQEASELVKKMSPERIIEHYRRREATKGGEHRLLRVSSQPCVDRFVINWSAPKLATDAAQAVATRVVDETLKHAQSVYKLLMEGSNADVALLGIAGLDEEEERLRRGRGSGFDLDDHVHFSNRSIVRPRPLDSDLTYSDLRPVTDRPPTPVPSEEQLLRTITSRLSPEDQELVEEITLHSERMLHEKMDREGLSSGKEMARRVSPPSSPTEVRKQLRAAVLEKLESVRARMQAGGGPRVPRSTMALIPQMNPSDRALFITDMSKVVSDIIGTTLKQAEVITEEALKATQMKLKTHGERDSESSEEEISPEQRKARHTGGETDGSAREQKVVFHPMFGGQEIALSQRVVDGSLAAFSVQHSPDLGHAGHDHAPPVSHMKEFFKKRRSMPAVATQPLVRADPRRHSMPATLPQCMDPSQMHCRNSFMSVVKPDLQTLPEYRDKTRRQVEAVLQDHSTFGMIKEAESAESEEDLLHVEEHGAPPVPQIDEPAAAQEAEDAVRPMRPVRRASLGRRGSRPLAVSERAIGSPAAPEMPDVTHHSKSLTASRMMLRCDSDPRLSLRESNAEIMVDIRHHDEHCEHHESHHETDVELQKLESSALGIGMSGGTASDTDIIVHEPAEGPLRRSGSAEGGPITHPDVDSDDETELRTHEA